MRMGLRYSEPTSDPDSCDLDTSAAETLRAVGHVDHRGVEKKISRFLRYSKMKRWDRGVGGSPLGQFFFGEANFFFKTSRAEGARKILAILEVILADFGIFQVEGTGGWGGPPWDNFFWRSQFFFSKRRAPKARENFWRFWRSFWPILGFFK